MLVAERVDAVAVPCAGVKVLRAITGVLADLAIRALRKNARVHAFLRRTCSRRRDGMEADVWIRWPRAETAEHICRLCEQDHCGCGHDQRMA